MNHPNQESDAKPPAAEHGIPRNPIINRTVCWKCTTQTDPWQDRDCPVTESSGKPFLNSLKVYPEKAFQEILGWGGCFNEKGWEALAVLSPKERQAVIEALFDPVKGCKFNICRIPIGASDFSCDLYSLAETNGDYSMEHFTLARDRKRLIPYIRNAMDCQPDLKIWGSPWSPPKWMKTGGAYTFGSLKDDEATLSSYALYLSKFVQAYRQEGIDLFAVMPQNESCWNNRDYPACGFTPDQYRNFLKHFLIPRFEQEGLDCEIWLGTVVDAEYGDIPHGFAFVSDLLSENSIREKVAGVGLQYATRTLLETNAAFSELPLMQTETPCGDGVNDWSYAKSQFDCIKIYLDGGVGSYMLWNMVLDETGRSVAGWPQSAPVTVDTNKKSFVLNAQFYMFKHFSGFATPGGHRIGISGSWNDAVAFRNPNGEIVVVAQNATESAAVVTIDIDGSRIHPELPPRSWNTFVKPA